MSVLALAAACLVAAPVCAQTAPAAPPPAASAPAAPSAPAPAEPAATAPAAPTEPAAAPAAAAPAAPASPAAPAAPAAPATIAGPVGPVPAGKAQIVFFRPSSFIGMAVYFRIRENGVELGKLSNGAYFVQTVDPGKHTFTAATENKDTLTLEIDDGETYYVRGGLSMGLVIAEANIAPSDAATFQQALKHMHPAEVPPASAAAAAAPAAKAATPAPAAN
ncbi:MAG TPA: DUF2846 domain-containing protein [Caulobacteraceae bacterium]